MSQRVKVVGARAPTIWLLIAVAVVVVAALAVGWFVILPARQAARHYQAGVAFQEAGEWEAARRELMQAIAIDADYQDAQARLAQVKGKLAEIRATATARVQVQATATARAAPTATAETLAALYQRAQGLINLEQWLEAQTALRAIFDVDPNYQDVQALLRQVNAEMARLTPTATPIAVPNGASPYGVLDMAGNVWEWVADWYESGYYDVPDQRRWLSLCPLGVMLE